jgi:hypothetical protein
MSVDGETGREVTDTIGREKAGSGDSGSATDGRVKAFSSLRGERVEVDRDNRSRSSAETTYGCFGVHQRNRNRTNEQAESRRTARQREL